MDWFNILYTSKGYSFNNVDEFNSTMETANSLSNSKDDSRVATIMSWLAKNHILKDTYILKMNNAMLTENIEKLQNAVDDVFDKISDIHFDDSNIIKYGIIIQKIVTSNGKFLSENYTEPDNEEYEAYPEESVKKFIEGVRNLQAQENHKLSDLITFVYENELNNIQFDNFSKDKIAVTNDLSIIVPVITEVSNVRKYEKLAKIDFYKSVLKDYDSDNEFVQAVAYGANENIDFGADSFNQGNLLKIIDVVQQNFPNTTDIAYGTVQNMMESMKVIREKADKLAKMFSKNKFSNYNLVTAIKHFNAYNGYGFVAKNIITNDDESDIVEESIDSCLKYILNGYSTALTTIDEQITQYNKLVDEPLYINDKIRMNLKEIVPLWKNFIDSDTYKYLAKSIDNDIETRCNRLITYNSYTIDIAGNEEPVIGKKGILILNIIHDIIIDKPENRFESIIPYIAPRFAKFDTSILMQLNVMIVVLNYLIDFFNIKFKNKADLDVNDKTYMSFDAICNIIYYKDKQVKESYVYEGMFFGSYAIMESESKLEYFNKLWKHIKSIFDKHNEKINLNKYVKNYADLDIPENDLENTVDSSVNKEKNNTTQTLSTEQINNLKNTSKEYLQAVDSLNGKVN